MEIPKLNLKEFLIANKGYKILHEGRYSKIIKLPNGELIKIIDHKILMMFILTGYDLEARINEIKNLTDFKNFALPNAMFEDQGLVTAYKMFSIPGVTFTEYHCEKPSDLMSFAKIHSQIEENVKSGNKNGIVFPDLCTTDNIIVTPSGKVIFIDYEGLQIKKIPTVFFSTSLGEEKEVKQGKYFDKETELYSKELDVKSTIFLYFLDVFGVDLSVVDKIEPVTGEKITLDYIFSVINLEDNDIKQKVWKLFQESVSNEFLGEDIYKLAENYTLDKCDFTEGIKTLKRK